MRIRRAIIPVIVALGVAGSVLGGAAAPAAFAQGPVVHAVAASPGAVSHMYMYG